MQAPWLFFTQGIPTAQQHHGTLPNNKLGSVNNPCLIPLNVGTAGGPAPPPPLMTAPPNPFATCTYPSSAAAVAAAAAAAAAAQHPHHHHHPHHSSQILLAAAAAAAAYGQQCAAAASLLHNTQRPQQISNSNYHLKVEESSMVCPLTNKRKSAPEDPENVVSREIKKAKLETKALKAKRPGFTDDRYNETSYYVENGLRKVYPYYFTFTTFTKGRWVGEKILDVFAREFRAHPVEEYERCIKSGTLTVNYTKVDTDYRLKHNDLLANIVHRHEVPVTSDAIEIVHQDEDLVVVNKAASIPVHPCGRYRHNTVVFILAKEHQLKNLRTIHRLDRLTSGLLLFGRSPKKAREMEQQIRNRLVSKEYVCRVEGEFPEEEIECSEPIEVVSYKIGVCKVSKDGKDCRTTFKKLSYNGKTSVVLARPRTGRMHQIRVHLQYLGYPIVNDPLYNHPVFGPEKGKGGVLGKTDEELIAELISIHNAENWLGIEEEGGGGGGNDIFGPPLPAIPIPASCPAEINSHDNSPKEHVALTNSIDKKQGITAAMCNGDLHHGIKKEELESTENSKGAAAGEGKANYANSTGESVPVVVGNKVTFEVGTQTSDEESQQLCTSSSSCSSSTSKYIQAGSSSAPSTSSAASTSSTATTASTSPSSPNMMSACSPSSSIASIGAGESLSFRSELMTYDPHCYECKVRYRDPKPKDLVMYLHALTYQGPGWCFKTRMPAWASEDWVEPADD